MHLRSSRTLALIAVSASVGGMAAATASSAAADASPPATEIPAPSDRLLGLPILGDLLGNLLNTLGLTPTVETATSVLAPLTGTEIAGLLAATTPAQNAALTEALNPTQLTSLLNVLDESELTQLLAPLGVADIGNLLDGANLTQLNELVGSLTSTQLTGALTSLTSGELTGLLGPLTGGQLTSVLGPLTGGQLTGLLDPLTGGELTGILDGLGLADLTTLVSTLAGATSGLQPVLELLTGATASTPLGPIVEQIVNVLAPPTPAGPNTGAGTGSGTGTGSATGSAGTGTGTGVKPIALKPFALPAGKGGSAPAFTRYRATVRSVKIAKSRKSAKVKVTCPANSPKGCLVSLSGKVAGKKAMSKKNVLLARNSSRTYTVKLTKVAAKRLKTKGGSLKLTASTVQSSLGSASKSAKVKAPKKKRASRAR